MLQTVQFQSLQSLWAGFSYPEILFIPWYLDNLKTHCTVANVECLSNGIFNCVAFFNGMWLCLSHEAAYISGVAKLALKSTTDISDSAISNLLKHIFCFKTSRKNRVLIYSCR